MKLKPDCVRDVLLSIERLQKITLEENGVLSDEPIFLDAICKDLPKQNKADIFYSLKMLEDGNLINMTAEYADSNYVILCIVEGLTFKGHEFLQSVKDEGRWTVIKKGLDAIRNYSLDAMAAVAEGVTTAGIQAFIKTTV